MGAQQTSTRLALLDPFCTNYCFLLVLLDLSATRSGLLSLLLLDYWARPGRVKDLVVFLRQLAVVNVGYHNVQISPEDVSTLFQSCFHYLLPIVLCFRFCSVAGIVSPASQNLD